MLKKKMDWVDWVCVIALGVFALIIMIPFFNVVMISITSQKDYLNSTFLVIPRHPTLQSFKRLFEDGRIWSGYKSTLTILTIGMPINVFLTYCMAYGLSRKGYPGRKIIFGLVLFTMIK